MRDVLVVKDHRDKLKAGILKITREMANMRGGKDIGSLNGMETRQYFDLSHLRGRYFEQSRALDFALNEDSTLSIENSNASTYLDNVKGFIVF